MPLEAILKSHTEYMTFETDERREFVRITEDVEREIAPNYVILRFRRPNDVVLLAVHRRELKRVGAVLQLPT